MSVKSGRPDELGLVLTFLRHLKGWTQKQLVAASGVSLGGLNGLELAQRRQPTHKTLGPIAAALGVDLAAVTEAAVAIHQLGGSLAPGSEDPSGHNGPAMPAQSASAFCQEVAAGLVAATSAYARGATSPRGGPPLAPEDKEGDGIGLALQLLRLRTGRSLTALAAEAGIATATLRAIEQGRKRKQPAELSAILAALGADRTIFRQAIDLVGKLRRMVGVSRPLAGRLDSTDQVRKQPAVPDQVAELLFAEVSRARRPTVRPGDVAKQAVELWPLIAQCPPVALQSLVRLAPELQRIEACEMFCNQSLEAAGDSAPRARQLAEMAVLAAELASESEALRLRLRGFAGAHLANALRIAGDDLPAAGAALDQALADWEAGASAGAATLNAARILSLKASMRRAQRRLPEALAALDEGLRLDRWGERPSLLLGKARALIELRQFAESIDQLQQAAAAVDGDREPRKLYIVENLLVLNLCHLGQFTIAEQRLPRLRMLAQSNRLDRLLAEWLAGKIEAGLGRTSEALALLHQVRADFLDLHNAYDAALVTLEAAEIYASLGQTAEVKSLAYESTPIFLDQQVHREARRALALFRQAAEDEKATAELLHRLLVYLQNARQDPQLR